MKLENNEMVIDYLNNVCSNIKNKRLHKEIKEELLCHIEESTFIHLKREKDENVAIKKALENMGDYKEIGENLNKVHKPTIEWSIIISALLISCIGLFALYYISNIENHSYFTRSLLFSSIGIIALLLSSSFNYSKIKLYSKYIYGLSICLILFSNLFGTQIYGARSFIVIGPISISLSEIIPILLLISLCDLIKDFSYYTKKINLLKLFGLTFIPAILLMSLGNIFCIIVYSVGVFTILKIKGFKNSYIIISIAILSVLFLMFVLSAPYRSARFFAFLNPESDPEGLGYVYLQIKEALSNSVFLGQTSNFNPNLLPIMSSDFILAFIIYKFGYLAGIFTISTIGFMLFKISKVLLKVKDSYSKSLIIIIFTTLSVKFIFGILINLGILPSISIAIPFLSYGGTSSIINFILLGLIINIYKVRTLTNIENLNMCK